MSSLLDAALSYTANGLSLIPMLDKHPHPTLLPRNEAGKVEWTPYQLGIPPVSTLKEWFGPATSMALVCGPVSGNLSALDFDVREGVDAYREYLGLLAQLDPDLANLPQETTPGGGKHVYFRSPQELSSSILARTAEKETLIELKASSSCLNCSPSPSYILQVSALTAVPTLSAQQTATLLRVCQSITRSLPPQKREVHDQREGPASRFDSEHGINDMLKWLTGAGWKVLATTRGVTYLTRPGKDFGISATLGWNGLPIFRNFSANSGFEIQAYGAFGLHAALKFNGSLSAAARDVVRHEAPQRPQYLRDIAEPSLRWDDVPAPTGAPHEAKGTLPPTEGTKERRGYRTLRGAALRNMPHPQELIEGWVLRAPTCMMYAKAGVGKTFVAMDMALCIASGRPWHGHAVMKGPVLYIAAEGGYGMGQRTIAWLKKYNDNQDVEDFVVVSHPVFPIWDETLQRIKDTIEEEHLVGLQAIFIDTLAQCFGEGDESDNHDSQMFLSAVANIAGATGATVFLIHHSGWDESRLRGASNFRNSIDTVIQIVSSDDPMLVTIKHDKIKDLEQQKPMKMERVKSGPEKEDSCYMQPVGGKRAASMALSHQQRTLLETMITPSLNGSKAAALIAASGLPSSSFYKVLGELARANMVTSTGEERSEKRTHSITEGGKRALSTVF